MKNNSRVNLKISEPVGASDSAPVEKTVKSVDESLADLDL